MAASRLPSQKSEEFKEQFLTCSICYEPYDKREHQAKCLPCLHTFCLSCLNSHAGKRPKLNCPQCRKEIILPGGSVDSLTNNFLVENLKEYQDLINHAVVCGDCDDEHQAVSFCHDCSLFLCTICVDIHRRKRSQRQHKLATMQELQQQNCCPRNEQVCQRHPAQVLTLYCKNTACKVPVCASCGLVDHRRHELIDLSAAIDEIIAEIKQFSTRVNGKTQELAKVRETIETEQNKLTRNSEQKIKDINELKNILFIMINSKCSQATSGVKQLCESEMGILTSKIELIDTLTAQMISACDFANKACDMNHPTQLLTSQHQILDRLRELENADLPKTSSDKTDFTFTDNHLSAYNKIQESVQQLCGIAWKQDTPTGIRSDQARFKPSRRPASSETELDCPRCKMRFAKGSCMHFKCPQCMFEFCCGCNKPFMIGNECEKLPSCARKGLHAHHPRDCLFHLQDWEVKKLQKLLHKHRIRYDTEPPRSTAGQRQSCLVLEQKETPEGLDDGPCGREAPAKHAGLCRLHYTEYLVLLINENVIDPAETFDLNDFSIVLTRNEIALPPSMKVYGESEQKYHKRLLKEVQEKLPFGEKPPRERS